MSTSLMFYAFGARSYDYVRTEYREGSIFFHLRKKSHLRRCPSCGSREVILDGLCPTKVRAVPIGTRPVFLVLLLHLLACKSCGAVRKESRDVAEPRKSYTRALARYILGLVEHMPLSAVATHVGLGWGIVKDIVKTEFAKKAKGRKWSQVRRIAIDEIAVRKGHRYMTVVVNLDSGEVLYVAEGVDHTVLEPFFRRLRKSRTRLEAIAVDMSNSYRKALKLYAPPGVAIVHDRYHVVANMNEVLNEVRRDEQNRLEAEGKQVIKGGRYLLLHARERLAEYPDKQARLEALLATNETLHKAYLLKEDLRQFWNLASKADAQQFIETWLENANSLGNRHVNRFAKTIRRYKERILAWYDHRITTGPLEGLNNKIKVLKRVAYGYRDMEFFKLRILFIHRSRFALVGA